MEPKITDQQKDIADIQIRRNQQDIKYDIRDFTVEYIVQKFRDDTFYVPEYQRAFIWPQGNKERFIESVVLGLPIPMVFLADMDDGRLEIVDGAQRIQTLEEFYNDNLELKNLSILDKLNGFKYSDLPDAQKRKLDSRPLRMVVLEDSTTQDRRQEIFNRINTGSVKAKPSEVRRGDFDAPFMKFIVECSKNPLFRSLCPVSEGMEKRREREELVLRFFAYSDSYKDFRHDVHKFLDSYVSSRRDDFDKEKMQSEFNAVLAFVSRYFHTGFAKSKSAKTTPRVRFEAIAVGVNLALRAQPDLAPKSMSWLGSDEFRAHTTTHASNSGPRLRGRIEYVRNMLLGK